MSQKNKKNKGKNKATEAKKDVDQIFNSLKYADSIMTEAAKVDVPSEVKETFEEKLKSKLLGGEHKNINEGEEVNENRYEDGQNYGYPTYNYEQDEEGGEELPVEEPTGQEGKPEFDADGEDLPVEEPGGEAPAGGGPDLGEPEAGEDIIDQPEDVEALVDELIDADVEEAYSENESIGLNDAELADPAEQEERENPEYTGKQGAVYDIPRESVAEGDKDKDDESEVVNEGEGEEEEVNENEKNTMELDEVVSEIENVSEDVDKWEKGSGKDAGDDDMKDKVKDSAKKIDQTKARGDAKAAHKKSRPGSKEASDDDLKTKVSDGSKQAAKEGSYDTMEGGDKKVDQTKGQGEAKKGSKDIGYKDVSADTLKSKVGEMKEESVIKSKALYKLAEKYLALEDKYKDTKLENYKAVKVNGLLALAPDLTEDTKISLVKKFDECKTHEETKKLYHEVVKLIKESNTKSIEEQVGKDNSMKVIKEGKQNIEANELDKDTLTEDQKRLLYLSGEKGYDDQYFNLGE